jgi:hypothetical protein
MSNLDRPKSRRLLQFVLIGSESCCGGDPELRIAFGGDGFEGSTPTEVGLEVFGCDAMEASHPRFEASVVGVDIVDVEFRLFGLWGAGRGQDVDFELARLAKGNPKATPLFCDHRPDCKQVCIVPVVSFDGSPARLRGVRR